MRQEEHHQLELERQQMLDEIAEEAQFYILTSGTLPITNVSEVEQGSFFVSVYDRVFKVSVKEI